MPPANDGTVKSTALPWKLIVGVLLIMLGWLLNALLPAVQDRVGMQDAGATLRTEVAQLKADAKEYVRRQEFEQYTKGLDQRLQSIERSLEKIDRKLDR